MPNEFPSAKLSSRMNKEARVVLCIHAKSGHVAVIVPQARLLKASSRHSLLLLFTLTPRYLQGIIQ